MNGIVVGLDESAPAADALRWVLREGALHDASVTAVMAWGLPGPTPRDPGDASMLLPVVVIPPVDGEMSEAPAT